MLNNNNVKKLVLSVWSMFCNIVTLQFLFELDKQKKFIKYFL